ncbi:glycine cleavage system H protein [Rhodoligotrophos appendicifer]|uniref:glycine cleavage system protein GcvH n=1 Tax=Rhodoligotrophos appendicifer TaxID=987056 RepID=UPI0011847868|nr:glycine cleavage system protein GcvH [Rhodoligotrophos appendicifer]
MDALKFTKDHEWIRLEGQVATVGITQFAQEQLGDVVFVELPTLGQTFQRGGEVAVVESVKAASDIFSPVSGEVIEVNAKLEGEPSLVNSDPEGEGWFLKMSVSNLAELADLLTRQEYEEFTKEDH